MADIYKFEFGAGINKRKIEGQVARAIKTAEYVFGEPKVRLNITYLVSKNKAVIDVSSDVGEFIVRVFIGLMTDCVGADKFTIEKIKKRRSHENH